MVRRSSSAKSRILPMSRSDGRNLFPACSAAVSGGEAFRRPGCSSAPSVVQRAARLWNALRAAFSRSKRGVQGPAPCPCSSASFASGCSVAKECFDIHLAQPQPANPGIVGGQASAWAFSFASSGPSKPRTASPIPADWQFGRAGACSSHATAGRETACVRRGGHPAPAARWPQVLGLRAAS